MYIDDALTAKKEIIMSLTVRLDSNHVFYVRHDYSIMLWFTEFVGIAAIVKVIFSVLIGFLNERMFQYKVLGELFFTKKITHDNSEDLNSIFASMKNENKA